MLGVRLIHECGLYTSLYGISTAWQITEVSNSEKQHAVNTGNHADIKGGKSGHQNMEMFAFASAVRGYRVYQDLWKPSIGEKLVAK